MNKITKKGFTLIELLAVIVILAIIALIATPLILNLIEKAKKGAFESTAYGIAAAAEYVYIENILDPNPKKQEFIYSNFEESNSDGLSLKYSGEKPEYGVVTLDVDGSISLWLWKNGYCAVKNENNAKINVSESASADCGQASIPPTIVFAGYANSDQVEITILPGEELNLPTETAKDSFDNDLSGEIVITNNVDASTPGTYTVLYTVTDINNLTTTRIITVIVEDTFAPVVSFAPNGNNTWNQSHNVVVSVTDAHSGVDNSSLKYLLSTSTTEPDESSFTDAFSNNGTINLTDVTGEYYLWILAKDNNENTIIERSELFILDNTAPDISNITINISNATSESFMIIRSGNATDLNSGLSANPYIYQISTNGTSWNTSCSNNATSCVVDELQEDTTYHYRVCVVDNALNEACLESKTTSTLLATICEDEFTDIRDGKIYRAVKIGNQCWMAENLHYTGNGCLLNSWNDTAPHNACMEHLTDWGTEVLYQWGAVMDGSATEGAQGICPDGWYIPTDNDWKILEGTVDSTYEVGHDEWENVNWRGFDAGAKLKSITAGGTDDYGFGGFLAGTSFPNGDIYNVDNVGVWFSSSLYDSLVWRHVIRNNRDGVSRDYTGQASGGSIRCILTQ